MTAFHELVGCLSNKCFALRPFSLTSPAPCNLILIVCVCVCAYVCVCVCVVCVWCVCGGVHMCLCVIWLCVVDVRLCKGIQSCCYKKYKKMGVKHAWCALTWIFGNFSNITQTSTHTQNLSLFSFDIDIHRALKIIYLGIY